MNLGATARPLGKYGRADEMRLEVTMRRLATIGLLSWAVLCGTGCYVASVAPFYMRDALLFEPRLLGTWQVGDAETWTVTRADGEELAYRLEVLEPEAPVWKSIFEPPVVKSTPTLRSFFTARLFKLDSGLFLDIFPGEEAKPDGTPTPPWFPGPSWWAMRPGTHVLVRLELEGDTLRLAVLDADKMDEAIHAGAATGSGVSPALQHFHMFTDGETWHSPGGPGFANTLLAASTENMQAFLRQHPKDIFEDGGVARRRR